MPTPDPPAPSRYRIAPHVRFTVIDGTAMLMDGRGERYLGLNEVATRIFELVGGGRDPAEVAQALGEEFDADPARLRGDVEEMIAKLAREGLIEPGAPEAP
jgi:hypothetical protein